MTAPFKPHLLSAQSADQRTVWLTADDRWSDNPLEAEVLEDEAHATIRLIDGRLLSGDGQIIRLVEVEAMAAFF